MNNPITPCLWFDNKAKEAAAFYSKHLKHAKILSQNPVVTEIEVDGEKIVLLDGGPVYQPNPSISLFYMVDTPEEIAQLWEKFSYEGSILAPLDKYDFSEKYGWLIDKYGISWQFCLGDIREVGQRITPFFTFAAQQYGKAEEALNFYSEIFKNSKIDGILRYGKNEAPEQEGTIKHAQVALNTKKVMFMDSVQYPKFQFTEGVSLIIHCESQSEIDYYWEKLTQHGEESMCGWLKDKYGISWQVIPVMLSELMSNPEKSGKAAQAFLQMRKLDIEKIVQATLQ